MNYYNPELCDQLAREYVLGTMPSLVRRRFQRLLITHPFIQTHVDKWVERLHPLASQVKPHMPPANAWRGILAKLDHRAPAKPLPWFARLRIWQGFAAFASIFAAVAIFMLTHQQPASGQPSYVAVMESANNASSIVAHAQKTPREITFEWRQMPTVATTDGSLHLWAVSEQTGQIQSLGTLNTVAKQKRSLSKEEWTIIRGSQSLFITVEKNTGRSYGKPVGPVLYRGLCVQLA